MCIVRNIRKTTPPSPLNGLPPTLSPPLFSPRKNHSRRNICDEKSGEKSQASQGGRLYTLTTPSSSPLEIREKRHRRPCMPAGNTTRARHVNNSLGERRGAAMFDHAPMPMQPRRFRDGLIQRDNGRRTISETDTIPAFTKSIQIRSIVGVTFHLSPLVNVCKINIY